MRSNSRIRSVALALAIGLVAAAGIARTRGALLPAFSAVKESSDLYALPSPNQVVVLSLGYRAALADFLFAHVLVWHGINFQEKRRLEYAADYLDTVSALDPLFRDPYYYGDTLIAMQPVKPRQEDYRRARRLLERGMEMRPDDTDLWLSAGQFIAYVAAPWLEDPKEQEAWELAGARRMARACELVGSNENIPYNCISAASLLSRGGEREATVKFLERVLAVSDDEEIRAYASAFLARLADELEHERIRSSVEQVRERWREDLPFVGYTKFLIVAPPFPAERCAGIGHYDPACATSWEAWRARNQVGN